jgi:stage II sporulation protein M
MRPQHPWLRQPVRPERAAPRRARRARRALAAPGAPPAAPTRAGARHSGGGLASLLHAASLLALTAGVCAGAAYASLNADTSGSVLSYVEIGLAGLRTQVPAGHGAALVHSLKANMGSLALIWASGLSVVGGVGALAVVAVRGFSVGFTVCFIVRELGLAGVALALASVMPHNLIAAPALVQASAGSLVFSAAVIGSRLAGVDTSPTDGFRQSATVMLRSATALILASLVQTYISPALVILAARIG